MEKLGLALNAKFEVYTQTFKFSLMQSFLMRGSFSFFALETAPKMEEFWQSYNDLQSKILILLKIMKNYRKVLSFI